MTVKVILKYWKDYADHWDYVSIDGAYLIARIRLDGPPNDTYKNGVYPGVLPENLSLDNERKWNTHYPKKERRVDWFTVWDLVGEGL